MRIGLEKQGWSVIFSNDIDQEKYDIIPIYISKDRIWYTGKMLMEMDVYKDFDSLKKYAKKVTLVKTEEGFCLQSTKGLFRKTVATLDILLFNTSLLVVPSSFSFKRSFVKFSSAILKKAKSLFQIELSKFIYFTSINKIKRYSIFEIPLKYNLLSILYPKKLSNKPIAFLFEYSHPDSQ